ncbi:MAG: hypothetical protein IJJ74_10530 [Eubacterium sp.]|nr:hypothetical protein [Eubacterium sp.]
MNELPKLLDDLITCGNKLTETAQALKDYYSATTDVKEEKPKKSAKKEAPKEEPKAEEPKAYTDVEVRAALAEKNKLDGKKYSPQVKALVVKYSADGTFSGIPEEKYTELMTELEGIGNG